MYRMVFYSQSWRRTLVRSTLLIHSMFDRTVERTCRTKASVRSDVLGANSTQQVKL